MKRWLLALAVSCLVPVGSGAQAEGDGELRWDLTAPGCEPRRPAPAVSGEPSSRSEVRPGVLQVSWERPGDRTIFAEFHRQDGGVYALCFWDTTGA